MKATSVEAHWVVLVSGATAAIAVYLAPQMVGAAIVGGVTLALFLLLFLGRAAAGAAAPSTTGEVRVVSKDGVHEAILSAHSLRLRVNDQDCIGLSVQADGTARLRLTDGKGKRRVGLAVIKGQAAGLGVTGPDGKQRVWLEVEPDGTPGLTLDSGNGQEKRITP